MTANSHVNVQAPAREAGQLLPDSLTIDGARLEVWSERTAEAAFWGRDARRFRAKWYHRGAEGDAYVEVRPGGRLTSEIVVALKVPAGLWGKIVWSQDSLVRLGLRFARAFRYEIETRLVEETDALTARRTTSALVKQRSA